MNPTLLFEELLFADFQLKLCGFFGVRKMGNETIYCYLDGKEYLILETWTNWPPWPVASEFPPLLLVHSQTDQDWRL